MSAPHTRGELAALEQWRSRTRVEQDAMIREGQERRRAKTQPKPNPRAGKRPLRAVPEPEPDLRATEVSPLPARSDAAAVRFADLARKHVRARAENLLGRAARPPADLIAQLRAVMPEESPIDLDAHAYRIAANVTHARTFDRVPWPSQKAQASRPLQPLTSEATGSTEGE